ncbi:MAG: phosphate signaling complex protein PhoU [Rhodothalassiaceae bacterium]
MSSFPHTLKSYDRELTELHSLVSQMAGYAQAQLEGAVTALVHRHLDGARAIALSDNKLDDLERRVERLVVEVIARRSPVADDLRDIIAALKISSALERIGDYAKNIAKRTAVLTRNHPVPVAATLPQIAAEAGRMINDAIDAYVNGEAEQAIEVWERDERVDNLYNGLFRELLTYMMENPKLITPCTHLLFCAKNIERVGDQATNIAELVYFAITGETMKSMRPKCDLTAFEMPDLSDDE